MVANMSDEDIWHLNRGGHDARKVYAAYAAAMQASGRPTVILAKTVKGFGLGKAAEGQMVAHQQKKLGDESLRELRDRFNIPVSDEDIAKLPFRKPPQDSEEMRYLLEHRAALGGFLPQRSPGVLKLQVPELAAFQSILDGTGEREISTTMAFVRILGVLLKDKSIGKHVVPIVPDEARTFGMEGLFRQIGIYSSVGQLYTPQDADQLMSYREDKQGQMLEEGINEAGSLCSWIGRGDLVREPRRADGAVLYFLFDVRLSARRRFHLGGRRHAGAWLPAGSDRRPHHARRRRTPAPGRPQPAAGDDGTELPRLRSHATRMNLR